MINAQRSIEAYDASWQAAAAAELARARAGEVATVSNRAAAHFLGIHYITLGKWRQRTPPLGPPFLKTDAQSGSMATNQHVHYKLSDLEAWLDARKGASHRERKAARELDELARLRRELELELELQQARDDIARLRRKLSAKGLGFASLADCTDPHEWVMRDGLIVGHVLTVSDADLSLALDDPEGIAVLSLEEALGEMWLDAQRQPFATAFAHSLEGAQRRAGEGLVRSEQAKAGRELAALEGALAPASSKLGRL